jgi:hypothetical protein
MVRWEGKRLWTGERVRQAVSAKCFEGSVSRVPECRKMMQMNEQRV